MLVTLRPPVPPQSDALPPHPIEYALEPASAGIDARTVAPERICGHCGHGIYAAPRAVSAFCPGCQRRSNLRNIDLHGEIFDTREVTAGTITVHKDARVSGELIGGRVIVLGHFRGTITASHTCTIRAAGTVAGRIHCKNIMMEEGSRLTGEIDRV